MSWQDLPEVKHQLAAALDTFDWSEVTAITGELIERTRRSAELFPAADAKDVLQSLRRRRRFEDIRNLCEALAQSGQDSLAVLRQYSQALLDEGALTLAKQSLDTLIHLIGPSFEDEEEERRIEREKVMGLLGRLHKQIYVDSPARMGGRRERALRNAIAYYRRVRKPLHQINFVACVARAGRDGHVLDPALRDEAAALIVTLKSQAGADIESTAIRLEAQVALGRWDDALAEARAYVDARDGAKEAADVFDIAGTLRQLIEVWGLSEDDQGGGRVVALLRSALLRRVGGEIDLPDASLRTIDGEPGSHDWWTLALSRCRSIARVLTETGQHVGSGFLVDPAELSFARPVDGPLLLTNWHVVSETGGAQVPGSVTPAEARIRFEAVGQTVRARRIMAAWPDLDACLVVLEPFDHARGCALEPAPLTFDGGQRERVYIIGHPAGRPRSFSIHDGIWLDYNDTHLHYRTPTQPGSSGSPVFDQAGWRVVALHCAAGGRVPRFRRAGTHEAHVGVAIDAIRAAIKSAG